MSRTSRPHTKFVGLAIAGCWLFAACSLASAACVGDCDDNGVTSISEVQTCINVYLGTQAVSTCSNCDRDNSGDESIGELGDSVSSFLTDASSCPQVTVPPTPTPGGPPLGTRVFSIADKPASAFYSSGLGGADVMVPPPAISSGPIRLLAGAPDANGVAPLSLEQDAYFGFQVIDQTFVCVQLLAAGSQGFIDCDGGSAVDAEMSQNSNGSGAPDPPVLSTEIGSDGGPGAAWVSAMTAVVNISPKRCSVTFGECVINADCPPGETCVDRQADECGQVSSFPPPELTVYTTGTLTARITNVLPTTQFKSCTDDTTFCIVGCPQGHTCSNDVVLQKTGENFSCADWTVADSVGTLLSPTIGMDSQVGDVVQILKVDD